MASETVASYHTSAAATDEQFVNKEKSEDIAQKILSLANEDEEKHGKPEDAQGQGAPSSKTEEGDEIKAELAAVEIEKSDNYSPALLEASAEDNLKHEKVEDTLSKTEGDDDKAEPSVVVEKTDDSVSLETNVAVADNLKEEKELIPESQILDATSTEATVKETPQQLEMEPVEIEEEKQHKTADIPEASAETIIEKSSNTTEANNPLKEAEILETSAQKEEKPVATEVQEKTEAAEKEYQEKSQEAEQPSTVAIPEPSAEVVKDTNNYEVEPTEKVKEEPAVTEVEENQKEPEKQEQSNTFAIPEHTAETSETIEEKSREPEFEAPLLKETNKYEAVPTETEKTEADENQSEPEKQSFTQEEEEPPKEVITEMEAESAEKPCDTVEVHPPKESDIELVKETGNSESEAVHGKEEKPETLSTEVEEKPREQLQVGEEVGETSKDVETEQDVIETVKSEGTLDDTIKDPIPFKEEKTDKEEEANITVDAAQVSSNEEAQAAPPNLVETSPEVAEKVVEENDKKESNFTEVIKGVSKEVAGVINIPEQASIDQEAKTGLKEEREYSVPASVEEKVAVAANDDKKEPETPDAVQESSREAEVEIKKVEEQKEAKAATTEAGTVKVESVKDDILDVDNKKEGNAETKVDEISTAVSEPVRETLASKFEEKEEESIKTGVDNLEKEQIEEPVKTEVQATKELPKETPAKPAQKQSNNILSKVKQSLVKAKKAITGKSPSSKNLSSEPEAKGDIKVK
ncbi:uncharacterized protein LOC133310341 [Gastrolobium bilobum]|uniref:uncharacterized protein LOC133310341 n=1 Tax=Gastrolobium bilobum TaxID=150636 RepID=UPI002AB3065D|nr:uncharacterized protein LOC133310341 [Gastrolobium bilobum]